MIALVERAEDPSTPNGNGTYYRTARGRPASRCASPPPKRSAPRHYSRRVAVKAVATSDDNNSPLSGEWIGITEALGWAVTRDGSFAETLYLKDTLEASIRRALWKAEHEEFVLSMEDAENQLLRSLRQGHIEARAKTGSLQKAEEPERPILSHEWNGLRFATDSANAAVAHGERGVSEKRTLHDVLLKRSSILTVFPRVSTPSTTEYRWADTHSIQLAASPIAHASAWGGGSIPSGMQITYREEPSKAGISPHGSPSDAMNVGQHIAANVEDVLEAAVEPKAIYPDPPISAAPLDEGEQFGPPRPTTSQVVKAIFDAWVARGMPSDARPTGRSIINAVRTLSGGSKEKAEAEFKKQRAAFPGIDWSKTGPQK